MLSVESVGTPVRVQHSDRNNNYRPNNVYTRRSLASLDTS